MTEEILLDLQTDTCQFLHSTFYGTPRSVDRRTFVEDLLAQKVIYYIDIEKFRREIEPAHLCSMLKLADSYRFHFRVNTEQYFEWFTAIVTVNDRVGHAPASLKITVTNQNILSLKDVESNRDFLRELLLDGFGSAYFNIIWVDVNNDSYKMLNIFGNTLDIEMNVDPVGNYTVDNKGYAINCVYKEDWDTFYQYTSLDWYREHLKEKGDRFSFMIRHIYNGEFRWVEVKTVCTRHQDGQFHVLYWVDDVNDKVYDNTAMKDTLSAVEVGQWRYEITNGRERKFTASPSMLRILEVSDYEDNETILRQLTAKLYPEDREKVRTRIFALAEEEEASFTFRLVTTKGLRYYRCGVTCVAKNEVYTCYQGYGQDITDIMQPMVTSIQHAEELSFTDKLTGLHNRNYMESRGETFMRRDDLPVSLIMADCNYLKRTNDTLGHEYGDLLLQRVARCIRESLPPDSIAMRIGGDEFLILCAHCPAQAAVRVTDAIRQKLTENSDDVLTLSVSFGAHTVETPDTPFAEAYMIADRLMYEEKQRHHKANPAK
ncbi:diguanylate cyclase domain-containing protein [Gemmiger sp.]